MGVDETITWRVRAKRLWKRMFPEREFYYRSRGHVHYVSLGGTSQTLISVAVLAFLGWVAFASIYLIFKNEIIDSKNRQIAKMELTYEELASQLIDTEERFTAMTRELEEKHRQLVKIVTLKDNLERKLGALTEELDQVSSARDEVIQVKKDLKRRLANIESDLETTTNERSSLSKALDGALEKLSQLTLQRDSARERRDALSDHVNQLEERLAEIKFSQQNLIARLHERTELNVAEMEEMIKITKLDLEGLVKRAIPNGKGVGGPLINLDAGDASDEFAGMDRGYETSVTALESHIGRWEALQNILQRLPLTAPVDSYSISSGYGRRKDPFTKRWASHHGLDLAGVFKSRVRATAAGVVTFAGRNGPLGRMIEIDHGLGLKTRYGHLHRILVKKGQRVDFREKIGLMGSTGRSTGYHVHYEVTFNGKSRNPANFLKAGRYVFKN